MLDFSFAIAITALTLTALSSWHVRATSIGRSFLGFVLAADAAAIARLVAPESGAAAEIGDALMRAFTLVAVSQLARLAGQAVNDSHAVSRGGEAAIWGSALVVWLLDAPAATALWTSLVVASASMRLASLPERTWDGFRGALWLTAGGMLWLALLPAARFVGLPGAPLEALGALSSAGVGLAFLYGLPRLGLLSSDRVQHGRVIQAMNDGVLVVDMNGRLVDFNEAAAEILDLDERARVVKSLDEALAHHPDLVELFNGAIDGRSIYAPESMRRRGAPRTFDLQLSALFDAAGSIESRVLVLRDISDRIEIEDQSRWQARQMRLVHEVSAAVHEAETIEAGLEAALALVARTMDTPLAQFLRSVDDEEIGSRLVASGVIYCGVDLPSEQLETVGEGGAVDGSVAGAYSVPGMQDVDPRGVQWWRDLGFVPAFTIPLVIGSRLYGMLEFFSQETRSIEDSTSETLEHVGELIGRAVERKLAAEKMRRLAFRDDLTGLPNRQRFHHLLRGSVNLAARANRRMALLFMDLDGFKKVNDTLGHEVGDRLLAEVASRFSSVVRVSDHIGRRAEGVPEPAVSRLGGDEFTVLLTDVSRPTDAALVAERLLQTLEVPIKLAGQELFMSTSIGIAVYPDDGDDSESLLRNADAAMYFAKGRGRNGYQFYSEEMNSTQVAKIEIEARLRGALERDDFELHYQPILDAESGEVVAAEALLRWFDEERGMVPPDQFVPVAEETGLIVPIGRWVFRTACAQAQRWKDEHGRSIRIGVNVSGHQIREKSMLQMVQEAVEDSGVDPAQVEIELTESTIMQDDALTVRTLRELREMGIGLALDDFGTGYSSLSYLRRFTIDRVKIDRSFVNDLPDNPDDAALTSAIVAMAHGLRLKVVAEGVETARQALFLRQRDCDEVQGYLFGRPCPAEEFVDRLLAAPVPIDADAKDDAWSS